MDSTINPKWVGIYKNDYWARQRVIESVRLISDNVKPVDTILDIGGFTQQAKWLLPSSCKYICIDGYAYGDNLVHNLDEVGELPQCDYVLCLETLEHLVRPRALLRLISKSLSHDGLAVISLPNEATIYHRLRCVLGLVDTSCFSSQGKHLHLPSLGQCSKVLLDEGFEIVSMKPYIYPVLDSSVPFCVRLVSKLIPVCIHRILAKLAPSLFARGFIFLCRKHN